MGRFSGLGNAEMSRKGVHLDEGEYDLEVIRCEWFTSRKKEDFFIVEFRVLNSSNVNHPVGTIRNWMPKMGQDMSLPNLKAFMLAALGIDRNDTEAINKVKDSLEAAVESALDGPDKENTNSLKGTKVHCVVNTIKTKEKQLPFNAHEFSPLA